MWLKNLSPLFPYLKKYSRAYVWGTICVLFMGVWVFFPLTVGRAFDDLNRGLTVHKLLYWVLLLLAIAAVKAVFQFLTRWIVIGASREIEFDLRNDMFRHLESLSNSFYQRTRTGDIMARSTNDLNAVRMLLGPGLMYPASTIVSTVGSLAFMLSISPKLTVFAFLPLPALSIIVQYFGRRIHDRFERIQAMFSEISARAQENFSGVRVIRAYAQEEAEIASFETSNREYIARSLKLVRLMGMLWPTLETMLGLAIVLVLWIGGREVINGMSDMTLVSILGTKTTLHLYGSMSVGDFVAFNFYMVQLTFPVIAMGWIISIYQRGTASLIRIHHLMTEKVEIEDAPDVQPSDEGIEGEIEFRNLNFSYSGVPNAAPVLHDINLRIPAGSSLAIVGPTGSGKPSLVSLIPRIYDTAPGSVLIDGKPVREYALADLRRNIGFVPQETFLFSETIRENIAFGVQSAANDDIRWAAEAANIAGDIEEFPEKYKTTLSGGQKQRTAIARALIRSPRILILDDALSSVDTQTEDKILNHLREVMQGRTTIFISHRVSTVRNADRIAVLHSGRIVELGTHDELLALNGYYTDLYNKQLLEEELAEV